MDTIEKTNYRVPYLKPDIEIIELLYEGIIADSGSGSKPTISEPSIEIPYDPWD